MDGWMDRQVDKAPGLAWVPGRVKYRTACFSISWLFIWDFPSVSVHSTTAYYGYPRVPFTKTGLLLAFCLIFFLNHLRISCKHTIKYEGDPKHQNPFIKNCVLLLTCLNSSHLQSGLHWMQYTYRDGFSTAPNSFWTSLILVSFSASDVFCFTSSSWQNISLWGCFYSGETTKQSHSGQDLVNREGGAQGSCCFWLKVAEHSVWCGQVPIMKWANMLKKSSKRFTEAKHSLSQQH